MGSEMCIRDRSSTEGSSPASAQLEPLQLDQPKSAALLTPSPLQLDNVPVLLLFTLTLSLKRVKNVPPTMSGMKPSKHASAQPTTPTKTEPIGALADLLHGGMPTLKHVMSALLTTSTMDTLASAQLD